ncbi:MAG: T9SS type A sorting domain-containing protein [Bacteroidales bacterium]
MRKFLLIIIVLSASITLLSQELPVKGMSVNPDKTTVEQKDPAVIKIFPVPVVEGRFTITSDIPFTFIRMTNIIGQEVTREKYYYPRNSAEITFTDAGKGIYLITIELEDKTKIVKKIVVESSR